MVVELAIGVLALIHGTLRLVALSTGIAVAGLYWAVGQNSGQLFSGQATDPSTGPLVIVLALAVFGSHPPPIQPKVKLVASLLQSGVPISSSSDRLHRSHLVSVGRDTSSQSGWHRSDRLVVGWLSVTQARGRTADKDPASPSKNSGGTGGMAPTTSP